MKRQIVLLALSEKNKAKCVAGKDIKTHDWIRPVSTLGAAPNEEVSKFKLGDVVTVELVAPRPDFHQTENHLYTEKTWRKEGHKSKNELVEYLDNPKNIWLPSGTPAQTKYLTLDEIKCLGVKNSLYLIKVDKLTIIETDYDGKPKFYGYFDYCRVHYALPIKDQAFIDNYKKTGNTIVIAPLICCSLPVSYMINGEPRSYKLIVGVIN
ncbi:MAG: hypothetical protein A2021_03790 [Elusimicrobia bacterium GWF2_52_66]|nr:MAG: hypothetical protein A2X33_10075 [Elusimicrobia bacterium GWA2_51_34]OGR84710.1 MAG: hypothetical protein A2021_03790 [Elusimicrobia bacterium GWF2_52_66]